MTDDLTKKHRRRRRARRGKKKRHAVAVAVTGPAIIPLALPAIPLTDIRARLHLLNQRRASGTSNGR